MRQYGRMTGTFTNLRTLFLLAFVILSAAGFAYNAFYQAPKQRCEGAGNWWDWRTRVCGHVVYLPDLTHKPAPAGVHRPG